MITRTIRRTFARLVKPNLKGTKHPHQLLYNNKHLLHALEQANKYMRDPANYSGLTEIAESFGIPQQQLSSLNEKTLTIQAYDNNAAVHNLTFDAQGQLKTPFQSIHFDSQPRLEPDIRNHYALNKGILDNLPEYSLEQNEILLFNLPANFTQSSVSKLFSNIKVQEVSLGFCKLGLPAFAKVILQNSADVKKVTDTGRYIDFEGRQVAVRKADDLAFLSVANRHLVIQGINRNVSPAKILQNLSKFGRVVHFQMPSNISRRMTPAEVKNLYDPSSGKLLKIKVHHKDGSTHTQYYPAVEAPEWKYNVKLEEFPSFMDALQNYKIEQYNKRIKYAIEVDAYEYVGEDNIEVSNKGFAFVAYSCTEEAQNCYFHMQENLQIERATKPDFYYDKDHQRAILRYADEKVLESQFKAYLEAQQQMDVNEESDEIRVNLLEKLKEEYVDYMVQQDQISEYLDSNPGTVTSDYLMKSFEEVLVDRQGKLREQLSRSQEAQKSVGRTFSEISELELFGTVLKDNKPSKYKAISESMGEEKLSVLENYNAQAQINSIKAKLMLAGYQKLNIDENKEIVEDIARERAEKLARRNGQAAEEEEGGEQEAVEEEADTPKAGFSTTKPKQAYRKASRAEKAALRVRYFQMTKDIVNEYFGIFPEEKINDTTKTYQIPTLNRSRQTLQDGKTPYLSEDDLENVLKFHYSPQEAQISYERYHEHEQAWKSLPLGSREEFREAMRNQDLIRLQLADEGAPQEFFEIEEGTDPEQLVNDLNLYEADFGQKYKLVMKDDKQYVAKMAILDSRIPLRHYMKIDQLAQSSGVGLDESVKKALDKEIEEFARTGKLSAKAKELGITEEISPELLTEMAAMTGIPKKYIESMWKAHTTGDDTVRRQELAYELDLERIRVLNSEVTEEDVVRETDTVDVKRQNGRYRTSRFRQM